MNRNLSERQGWENDSQVKKVPSLKERDFVRAGQVYGSEGTLKQPKGSMEADGRDGKGEEGELTGC